ncbi:MAG TPA: hypothetical protein DCP92_19315 [Nitrospiraceae bacterium]|nr:hypothetical protein [Nitrospiraceae bacterium]
MEISGNVFGIETIAENIEHARSLGLEMDRLFFAHALPSELPSRIDLWLFQDSFEHLADPAAFFDWLSKNSSEQAQLLIVLPEAGSISERLLGRFWPHKLNDHRFHWSRKGLIGFLSVRKFNVSTFFRPVKYISLATIVAHIMQKMVTPKGLSEWIERAHSFDLRFHFNIGEMGILLRKNR